MTYKNNLDIGVNSTANMALKVYEWVVVGYSIGMKYYQYYSCNTVECVIITGKILICLFSLSQYSDGID
jgi:hypothetical protein